jgi:CBS domain-containing protein
MRARDVMVRDVVTVTADTDIDDAIKLLVEHDISALPVVDGQANMVGIISEADLIQRPEIGAERQRPWWLEAVTGAATLADEFAKAHGKKVGEMMTQNVVSANEDTPLSEIAALLERKRIKRVPITRGGKVVGVVSRANLIQALASVVGAVEESGTTDRKIRDDLLDRLKQQPWTDFGARNVIVSGGEVHLWGLVNSDSERRALIALAENVPGVTRVADEMFGSY